MNNKLINYFQNITDLSSNEILLLSESMITKTVTKGQYLLREGQMSQDSYFVLEGLVRQYKNVNGNDITTNFFTEEQWIIALDNFDLKSPANYNLVCMEDTSLVIGNEKKAKALFNQIPRFETISRQIMESVFLEQQNLLASYITDKPEQRYLKLLNSRPDIFQRVPQYDIATYIGVKPESLSRIRKKLQIKS